MPAPICFISYPRICGTAALAAAALSAGCAHNPPAGYYDPPPPSSRTDAQYQAEGAGYRSVLHAPSQVRIELKHAPAARTSQQSAAAPSGASGADTPSGPAHTAGPDAAPTTPAAQATAHLMPQAQTYMGTLPCFSPGLVCTAQRVTLTLAPNGHWRGRITVAEEGDSHHTAPLTEQGCWVVTGERPPRILLLDIQGGTRTEFVLAAHNVLRVKSVAGNAPNLDYSLTRQPDLDPIDELNKQPAPQCP